MSDELARERENYAESLSQKDIYRQVVRNAIKMDAEPEIKAEILLGAIPDIGVIYNQLRFNNRVGDLNNEDFKKLLQIIIEKLESEAKEVEFNPLSVDDEENK